MKRPEFFIVGAPKCGTTSLYRYLQQHPQIFVPARKEPHFFGTDIQSPWFLRDERQYLALFDDAAPGQTAGEASVWYLYSRRAAAEIHQFAPAARILIMLRNPVDMIYSLHSHNLYRGSEVIDDFALALEAEEDRRAGRRVPREAEFPAGLYYTQVPRFCSQVQRFLDVFPREAVHVILYDDFRADTARAYRETLEFLNLNPCVSADLKAHNSNKRPRSRLVSKLLRASKGTTRVMRLLIPRSARRGLYSALLNWNAEETARPPMDPHLRARLTSQFAAEVEQLSGLLDRDLTGWSRPAPTPALVRA